MDTHVQSEPDSRATQPWNKGKITGAKPPLRPKHVWEVRTRLQLLKRFRDLALFNLAIDSKLRGCDVVGLRIADIAPSGYAVDRASVRQRKTGGSVRFEITEQTRQAIDDHLSQRRVTSNPYLFPGRGPAGHLTARQYARLLAEWLAMIGLDPCFYGTHSLRRTKATLIYKKTGNLRAVQLLLGHTKIESTVRYLGRLMTRLQLPNKSMSENRARADMLCLLIHGRFVPEADIWFARLVAQS
jgi:integrase